jgi:hypothetical protein
LHLNATNATWVTFVLKMARKDIGAAKIFGLLTKPLARSGYWT